MVHLVGHLRRPKAPEGTVEQVARDRLAQPGRPAVLIGLPAGEEDEAAPQRDVRTLGLLWRPPSVLERHDLAPRSLAMVGDRIYTDIEMARRAGAFGVLVLSGEATRADAEASSEAIDLVAPSLKEFGEYLDRARAGGSLP